jgi:hypothetical protein
MYLRGKTYVLVIFISDASPLSQFSTNITSNVFVGLKNANHFMLFCIIY